MEAAETLVETGVPEPRMLVCEGRCNPDLREYDKLVSRVTAVQNETVKVPKYELQTVMTWARSLNHTVHKTTDRHMRYGKGGWCRQWVCADCGHTKFH